MIGRVLSYLLVLLALAGAGPTLAFWQSRDSNSNVAISTGACTPTPIVDPTGASVASNSPSVNATTQNVPAGKTVIAAVNATFSSVAITGFSDPGNTWNGVQANANSTNFNGALVYKINAAAIPSGTHFTATTTGNTGNWSLRGAWIACHSGPLDQFSTLNQVSNTNGITVGPTSTLAAADDTAYGYAYVQNGGTVSNDPAYQDLFTNNFNTVGYKNLASTTGPSFSPTWTTSTTSSSVLLAFRATQPPAAYTPQGVNFSADSSTGAYASKASALTGLSSSGAALISFWVNNPAATGSQHTIFSLTDGGGNHNFLVPYIGSSTGKLSVLAANSGGTFVVSGSSATNFFSMGSTWAHVLISYNLATPRCEMYINDGGTEALTSFATCTSGGTVALASATQPQIGAAVGPFGRLNANVADLQVWGGIDRPLSTVANRRLFIDGSGNAVDPATAQSTLGTPAILLCSGAASSPCTGAVTGWITNKNTTAGGFTLQAGSITAASSNPP